MIISDKTIREMNERGYLVEEPLTDIQLQPNSIDLTLGNTWKKLLPNSTTTTTERLKSGLGKHVKLLTKTIEVINPRKPMKYLDGQVSDTGYIINPGEFILMGSREILNIPNGIVGLVCGRSSIARLGIQTEQAGFIDSGFRGTITFEIQNHNSYPILLYYGMRVAQVYFLRSEYSDRLYGKEKGSKYKDQVDATESKIHLDQEFGG